MKKTALILVSVVVLLAFALTACGQAATTTTAAAATTAAPAATTTAAPAETTAAPAAAGLRLGFGSVVTAGHSAQKTDAKPATAESYTYYASVLIDANSKIVKVWIDAVVHDLTIDDKGAITSDLKALGSTKRELGDKYGMKKASAIGKEWWEQADALEAYLVGKTIADIDAAAKDADGKFVDLKASSTFSPTSYIDALKKAVAAAEKATPTAATKLGFGTVINTGHSANAAADKAGKAESYTNIAVVAVDDSGKILDTWIDAVVHDFAFDAKGVITSDFKALGATKRELGDAYGMKKASAIGKEWWEQANALEAYLEGKTIAEIDAAAKDADGKFVDLKASSTFGPTDYITALAKAVKAAK